MSKRLRILTLVISLLIIALSVPGYETGKKTNKGKSTRNTGSKTIVKKKVKKNTLSSSMLFEINKGQSPKSVKFLSRGANYHLQLSSEGVKYQFTDPKCEKAFAKPISKKKRKKIEPCKIISLEMDIDGINSDSEIFGKDRAITKTGYFLGNDSTNWIKSLDNFKEVHYQEIYGGIDALFKGVGQNLEFDFIVSANSDPNQIRLKFSDVDSLKIDKNGDLLLKKKSVRMLHQKPVAYQIIDGNKIEVSISYKKTGKNKIGFELGNYDKSRELIIDPIVYASYLGTFEGDRINDIAVDDNGNIYTASNLRMPDPTGTFTYSQIQITKFNPDATAVVYQNVYGGAYDDVPNGIDVDDDEKVYLTGITFSPDFPLNFAEQETHPITQINSHFTGFFIRLHADGDIQHSTYLGGNCPDEDGESVVADADGNAYVTGYTCSTSFNTTNGFQTSLQGNYNAFLTKYDSFGHITYSTFFGGDGAFGADVYTDGLGNAYLTGLSGAALFTTSGASSTSGPGFLAKFNTNNSGSQSITYSTAISKEGAAVASDPSGNAWVAMSRLGFSSTQSARVLKMNPTGTGILFESAGLGPQIRDIAVDLNGSAYFAEVSQGDNRRKSTVKGLRPNGSVIGETEIDATRDDSVFGVALGPESGIVFVGGYTTSLDLQTTPDAFQPTSNSSSIFFGQGFFAKVTLFESEEKTPLIFIPGILGSKIRGNWNGIDTPFWVSTYLTAPFGLPSVYNLTTDTSSPYYTEGLYPSDAVRTVLGQDFYESLIQAFKGMGYTEEYDISQHFKPNGGCDLSQKNGDPNLNPSLFVYPYDWRQDNIQSADKLKDYIECVQQFYPPGTDIDVVAHSMGGLVVRRYILQTQLSGEQHGLGKVITIGSPLLGAPGALHSIYTGGKWELASFVVIPPPAIRSLAPSLVSMHQLFPSRIYHQFNNGIMNEIGDVDGNGIPDENYSFSRIVSKLDADFPGTTPGTVGAGFHDTNGQDNWQNDLSGIQYYHIVAEQNQLNTTVGLSVKESIFCRLLGNTTLTNCYGGVSYKPEKGFGDGTVPTISASRVSGNTYLGAPDSKWFLFRSPSATSDDEKNAEHTGITQFSKTHELLGQLLKGEVINSVATTNFDQPSYFQKIVFNKEKDLSINSALEEGGFIQFDSNNFPPANNLSDFSPSYYLSIHGTTNVIVKDGNGNITSIEDGFLSNKIEGLLGYESVGEQSVMLTFSVGNAYTVEFHENSAPISIEFIKGRGNLNPSQAVKYIDLNLPLNSNSKLSISQDVTVELVNDSNNDGEYESFILPDVDVVGGSASDVIPPSIDINFVQDENEVTAILSAEDYQSGLKTIWYSLDGQSYQIYSTPLTFQRTPNPIVIKAFADDFVANRSGSISRAFTFPPAINPDVMITAPPIGSVYPVGTSVSFAGSFSDDECNSHSAIWTFENITAAGEVDEVTREVSIDYTFTSAGVYLIKLTINNGCGGVGSAETLDGLAAMVVIYDPTGGFVTGGGWIDSPIGAFTPDSSLTGKASFGFNSKYENGANMPTGNTEFQFRVADFNFKSTSYDWLVVGGARAKFKGTGTIMGLVNLGLC